MPENRCQQNAARTNRYPSMIHIIWRFTKISIFPCFSPNLLKTELISCNNCILWTFFLVIKQKGNCNIYSILWKCQQGRSPSRIDISPNKSLGTPVKRSFGMFHNYIIYHIFVICICICLRYQYVYMFERQFQVNHTIHQYAYTQSGATWQILLACYMLDFGNIQPDKTLISVWLQTKGYCTSIQPDKNQQLILKKKQPKCHVLSRHPAISNGLIWCPFCFEFWKLMSYM